MNFLFIWNFVTFVVSYISFHSLFNSISVQNDELLFRRRCLDLLYGGDGFQSFILLNDEIIEFNQGKQIQTNFSENILNIGCTTYKAGQSQVSVQEYLVEPLLVDLQNDVMCFMFSNAMNSSSNVFKFKMNFPDVYKISQSMYHVIENFKNYNNTLDEFDLSISYVPITTSTLTKIADNHSLFIGTIEKLSNYSIDSIVNNFFWSSPLSMRTTNSNFYFLRSSTMSNTNTATRLEDIKRRNAWNMKLPLSNNSLIGEDPCAFKTLTMDYVENRIIIPMKQWRQLIPNIDTYESCMILAVSAFAQHGSVYHISALSKPKPSTYRSRSIQQTGVAGASPSLNPYTSAGLTGVNQVISIADTGVDVNSCLFSDSNHANKIPVSTITNPTFDTSYRKVIQYIKNDCGDNGDVVDGHGTHVASIAAGSIDGDLFYNGISEYSGIAPGAKLAILDLGIATSLCIPSTFSDLLTGPYAVGARVFSYSWDSLFPNNSPDYQGHYIDKYLYHHPEVLILFAAGNSGQQGRGSISLQSTSKNIVSVGAGDIESTSGNTPTRVSYYSSQGPTYDGRFKPDIIAPGDGLQSAHSNGDQGPSCTTTAMSGTSCATPSAAGIALMIRQYFEENSNKFWLAKCNKGYVKCRSSFSPSGVLIKAILLHSGKALQEYYNSASQQQVGLSDPPDHIQGYGRIWLKSVLPLDQVYTSYDLYVDDLVKINEDTSIIYKVKVQYSNKPLKITLVWYDPPAVTGTTQKALIHDLDLTVISPTKDIMYGNGGSKPDSLNSNEQVYVAKAAVGIWKVIISTNALALKSQRYSIVITSKGYVIQP